MSPPWAQQPPAATLCVFVSVIEKKRWRCWTADAPFFICALYCLPCADGTPGWICAISPAAADAVLAFEQAGVARKRMVWMKKWQQSSHCSIVMLVANCKCVHFSILEYRPSLLSCLFSIALLKHSLTPAPNMLLNESMTVGKCCPFTPASH